MTNGSDDCMAKTEGFAFILNTHSAKELIKKHSTVGVLLTAKKNELPEQLICFFPLPALKKIPQDLEIKLSFLCHHQL